MMGMRKRPTQRRLIRPSKTIANTSSGPADPQRARPYFIEDGSTPDWSENFSSLKLSKVVVPSASNITELNLSNSQMGTEDITKVLTVYKSTCQKGTRNKTYWPQQDHKFRLDYDAGSQPRTRRSR